MTEEQETSVCDNCDRNGWDCYFCCAKCYEDYGECLSPEYCNPYDV